MIVFQSAVINFIFLPMVHMAAFSPALGSDCNVPHSGGCVVVWF